MGNEPAVEYIPESPCSTETIVKKSRFLGFLYPIGSSEEAEAVLSEIATLHKTASHHCFAYTLGRSVPFERFSDAGEPSGTAGRPILEVIRRRRLRNALVVVTRYFGGVMLGAGGLTRAYAGSTAATIDAAVLLQDVRMRPIGIVCDYGSLGKLEFELTQAGNVMFDKGFAEEVSFRLWVAAHDVESIVTALKEWTAGRVRCTVGDETWVGIRPDGSFYFYKEGITP